MTDNSDTSEETAETGATAAPISLWQSIKQNALLLGCFALACTAVISSTYLGTADNIAEQKRQAKLKALYEILPQTSHDNDLLTDTFTIQEADLGHRQPRTVHMAKRQGKTSALIYPVTARDGYSGDIDLIVGLTIDGNIAGVRVLNHRETPGLGDKIEVRKSDWITSFNGKSLKNTSSSGWGVQNDGGEFDAFTGATITPRAVVKAVHRVLLFHSEKVSTKEKTLYIEGYSSQVNQP